MNNELILLFLNKLFHPICKHNLRNHAKISCKTFHSQEISSVAASGLRLISTEPHWCLFASVWNLLMFVFYGIIIDCKNGCHGYYHSGDQYIYNILVCKRGTQYFLNFK